MKCFVLAGGRGDRMWPLSRANYPKQFMEIQEKRTIFQETIARNMVYCDEFYIITNQEYQYIVEGQMEIFQGIQYRCFFEEKPHKTTAAIVLAAMQCPLSETILVVGADQIIEGEGYKDAIVRAKELCREGSLITIGRKIENPETSFGYILADGEDVIEFKEKPDKETAERFMEQGDYLWNTGMFVFRVGDLLNELKKHSPDIFEACQKAARLIRSEGHRAQITGNILDMVPKVPIEYSVFEKSKKVKVVTRDFHWQDIGSLEDLDKLDWNTGKNHIKHKSKGTTVINQADNKLVLVNHVEDLLVVNTDDSIYIGKKGTSDDLKEIIRSHPEKEAYFSNQQRFYRQWGLYDVLEQGEGFKIKKAYIFPGKTIYGHIHHHRSENWTIISGRGRITIGEETRDYNVNDVVQIRPETYHQVSNIGDESLIIIEVSVGELLQENDVVSVQSRDLSALEMGYELDAFVKLEPAFKDYLWGGTNLRDVYGKKCDYDIVAESWELSAHPAGQSTVATGRYSGSLFTDYLKNIGKETWGWKCQSLERFPILIKFIDAKDSLSIQVHPDDDYALINEQEYGKNEMWYIVDCEEGAGLYCGFNRDMSKDEVEQRIQENTILEVLNWVPVKKGDVFFIPAGTVHAIGKGILICEIQQSSNSTYRLYDYDRRDKFGNTRELHIQKSLDVLDYKKYHFTGEQFQAEEHPGYVLQTLSICKYFECTRYDIQDSVVLDINDSSFNSVVCTRGKGRITAGDYEKDFKAADSIFIPAQKEKLTITGPCEIIVTHI